LLNKKRLNKYDENIKKLKTELMQSIVQQHEKASARSASLESQKIKTILVKDIEEAESIIASQKTPIKGHEENPFVAELTRISIIRGSTIGGGSKLI